MPSLEPYLQKVVGQAHLSRQEACEAMGVIMDGHATPVQISGMLVAMRMKGETSEEVAGFAEAMRSRVTPVKCNRKPLLDTCGTGGDRVKTFNISTAAAFIVAAAGVTVAKHGNRAVTSACGSADVLEHLGARLDLTPERVTEALEKVGVAFLFAPNHHPAMRHAAPVRKELGLRTVFNILGPLTNPAGASRQAIGVYDPSLVRLIADALCLLGTERSVVYYGEPGIDEVSVSGVTRYALVENGRVFAGSWDPKSFEVQPIPTEELRPGATTEESAELVKKAISDPGTAYSAAAIASAAVALWVAGEPDLGSAVKKATEAVRSGAALAKLMEYVEFTSDPSR